MYAVCLQTSMYIVLQPESVYSTGSFHFLRSFFLKKILIDMGYQGVIIQQLYKCFRSQFDLTWKNVYPIFGPANVGSDSRNIHQSS